MTTVRLHVPADAEPAGPLWVPGGVAAPDRRMLYIAAPHGGLQAVVLDTGTIAWTTTVSAMPLVATSDTLVTLASLSNKSALVLVLLDAATGEEMARSKPLVSPPARWHVRGAAADDTGVTVWWERREPFAGVPRQADGDMPKPAPVVRAHRITLPDGAMKPTDLAMPEAMSTAPHGGGGIPAADGALLRWTVNGEDITLVDERRTAGSRLLLASAAGRNTVMSPAPMVGYVDVFVSDLGARLILLVTNDAPVDGQPAGTVLTWHLFSVPDGASLGSVPFEPGSETPAAAFGDRLLIRDTDGVLHSLQMPSGEERWSVPTAGQLPVRKRG